MPLSGGDPARMLVTLQRLLAIAAADLPSALIHATTALAEAVQADKVDAFLYDDMRDSLVAVGSSTQPLSSLQRKLGLDVLPLSNGGRVVGVYKSGNVHRCGRVREDAGELRGIKESLGVQSQVGFPLTIGSRLRGVVMICSTQPDHFTEQDETFAASAVQWLALVAHRAELVEEIERNAREQGRQAAAEELITVLAHDLRNYVSPIAGRLHLLRQGADAKQVQHVEAAQRGIARISGLITNLLDVARLDHGLLGLDPEPVDLPSLARESAAALATSEHEIVVKASEEVLVAADPSRLRQCLDNLLSNAVSHSPREAPVNVFISRADKDSASWGQLEVIDEGPGIPEAMLPQLFDRFVSGRAAEGGMGLGLYLARHIASAHGGELHAESPPGKGARFVLRIPLYTQDAGAPGL